MKQIYWLLELKVREGQSQHVLPFVQAMTDATQSREPGALAYEWSQSADGTRVHVFERFADSDAVLEHQKTFAPFAERFGQIFAPVRCQVHGPATAAVKEAIAGLSPSYHDAIGGFRR